ncbi:T9SS type A sorting domain-containing protein [Chryseobacterium sp. S-02]|uniref:T9SS type A sorting domain-containing protein n=1 Tax=Chryseobacterium sp. S-02 TaxID=3404064 RepID=UPI003CE9F7EA
MNNIFSLLALMLSLVMTAQTAPVIQWQKTLGGSNWDQGSSVCQTTDGGCIIAGYSPSTDGNVTGNHGDGDYWVVKLNNSGNIQWQKSLGGSGYDYPYSVQQTSEGGYIVAGRTQSNDGDVTGYHGSVYSDFWIVKLDPNGNIQWQKSIGGNSEDVAYSIKQTSDGGYIVAGESSSTDGDAVGHLPYNNTDLWIVKINNAGDIQWQKSFGGYNSELAFDAKQTSDGGYIVAGATDSNSGDVTLLYGEYDYWVLKLDSTGNLQWQKTFGGSGTDNAQSVIQTSDGGYMVAGFSRSGNGLVHDHYGNLYTNDAWIIKLDASGNIIWKKSKGGTGNDVANFIKEMPDGGYVFAGYSSSDDGDAAGNPTGSANFWIVKINNNGNVIWQKSMGGSLGDFGQSMSQTLDGGFVMTGYSYSNDGDISLHYGIPTYPDFWVVKLGPEVLSTNETEFESFSLYPNPATDKLFVSGLSSDEKYEIYSVTGQKIMTGKISQSAINVSSLQKGVYFIQIGNKKQKLIKK